MNDIINEIANEMKIRLVYNNETKDEPLYNNCMASGDIIWIGEYKDKELELISFFHEIGHILIKNKFIEKWKYNTLMVEIECWNIGIEEGRKRNILFSDKAIEWAYKKAMSYVGHDERECRNWDEKYKPSLWVNVI